MNDADTPPMDRAAKARATRLSRTFLAEPLDDAPTWVRAILAATWASIRVDLGVLISARDREPWELAVALAHAASAPRLGLDGGALTGSLGVDGFAVAGSAVDREDLADVLAETAPARVGDVMRAPSADNRLRVVAAHRDGSLWIGDVVLRRERPAPDDAPRATKRRRAKVDTMPVAAVAGCAP